VKHFLLALSASLPFSALAHADTSEALEGAWKTACLNMDGEPSRQYEFRFSGEQVTMDYLGFADTACNVPALMIRFTARYTLPAGDELSRPQPIDLVLDSVSLTPRDQEVTSYFNTTAYCGFADWQADTARDVTGNQSEGCEMPAAGDVLFNLIQIQEGVLTMGRTDEEHNGSSPDTRPTELNRDESFTRSE
jgi:hypothetical protein